MDGYHRAWVACPVKLDSMGVAAAGRGIAPAEIQQRPVVVQHLLDSLGALGVVAVEHLDAIEIDATADARAGGLGVEGDAVEVTDAFGQTRMVELKVAARIEAHCAEH